MGDDRDEVAVHSLTGGTKEKIPGRFFSDIESIF